jgi:hypothetical protein
MNISLSVPFVSRGALSYGKREGMEQGAAPHKKYRRSDKASEFSLLASNVLWNKHRNKGKRFSGKAILSLAERPF